MNKFLFALVICFSPVSVSAQPMMDDPNLTISEVVSGLSFPTAMAFIGPDDILVLQKMDGKVMRVTNGTLQANPVLDVDVDPRSFGGLVGITLHPDFQNNNYVYLFYTEGTTGNDEIGFAVANRFYRYTWNSATSTLINPTLILDLPVSSTSGNYSGVMAFGPDGKLYVTVGDLGRTGQLQNNPAGAVPDDTSVIFRVNDDGTIPKNNPFFSQGGAVAKYFAYGIRNSFGMAFDPLTGKLWNTENGPTNFDEINLVERGFNSGWNKLQGPVGRDSDGDTVASLFSLPRSRYADPKFSWFESIGITAITFLDSVELGPEYENNAFVGDYVFGNLSRFELNKKRDGFLLTDDLGDRVADNANERNDVRLGADFNGITDLEVGPDGLLYVLSIGDGAIYVIHPVVEVGTTSLLDGEKGWPYSINMNISGGTPPYTVALIDGSLPAGLNIAGETITGTPTQAQRSSFTLQFIEQDGASFIRSYRMRIFKALAMIDDKLPKGRVNKKYAANLGAKRGKRPYTWSLAMGSALPAGLALDLTNGKINGIPTAAGTSNLTFIVTDALGAAVSRAFKLTIE